MYVVKGEYRDIVLKCIVAFLFPIALCYAFCCIRGTTLKELYVPDSINNDSLFYFKITQGVVYNGLPQGYFGYNESRAAIGSFGVWNPLIVLPWVIWGLIFGWSYGSALYCNIVLFSVSLVLFVLLARVQWKSLWCMLGILSLFPSLPLHLLSCLPEANLLSCIVIYLALAVGYDYSKKRKVYIGFMSGLCVGLTVIRPFMIILFLVPGYYLFRDKIKGALVWSVGVVVLGTGLFWGCGHFFSAPYFLETLNYTLIECLLCGKWREAYRYVRECLRDVFPYLLEYIRDAFEYGLTAGVQYVVALTTATFSCCYVLWHKSVTNRITHIMMVIMNISLIAAIVLIYRQVNEGGRLIYAFAVVGVMICCLERGMMANIFKSSAAIILLIVICRGGIYPTDYDIPIQSEYTRSSIEYWEKAFENSDFELSGKVGYENTLIWCLGVNHKELFATPQGIGISCCSQGYLFDNFEHLKSRLIAIPVGSDLDKECKKSGFDEVGRNESIVIYQRY